MDKKFLTILVLLVFGVAGTFIFKFPEIDSSEDSRILSFPKEIGDYSGQDIELQDKIYDILETRNVIMREYRKKNEPPILLYLIFSKSTHKTSDPPENCLQGDGYSILEKEKENLAIGPGASDQITVNKLIAGKPYSKMIYLYWFLAGDKFKDSYFKQRMKLISSFIRRRPLSGGQVRISTQIIEDNEQEAVERLQVFVKSVIPHLKPLLEQK